MVTICRGSLEAKASHVIFQEKYLLANSKSTVQNEIIYRDLYF